MSTHNQCFGAKIGKIVYPCKPQFHYIKVGCKGCLLHGLVFEMYLPLLNYGPLTNKGMKFRKCCMSKSIIASHLNLVSADRG